MKPTDISAPDYFHKVVDCQWACPAHTPVPEYIRLIAEGRYSDAYMINWKSNVFPGILGTHLRPPLQSRPAAAAASRTNRWRSAASSASPPISRTTSRRAAAATAQRRTATRIALVGGGPASLTVARDLAPLGYDCMVFDARSQSRRHDAQPDPEIPPARLRDRRGDRLHPPPRRRVPAAATRIDSLKKLLAENLRRDLRRLRRAARPRARHPRPQGSRRQHPYRHRLAVIGVVRPYRARSAKRVIVLGGGNTAMDCRRSARRLGGDDVQGDRALRLRGDEGLPPGRRKTPCTRTSRSSISWCRRLHARRTASSPASSSRR